MEDELKDHVSLLVIQSERLILVSDLLLWVKVWCEGLYEDLVIRNSPSGGYEIFGKKKDISK